MLLAELIIFSGYPKNGILAVLVQNGSGVADTHFCLKSTYVWIPPEHPLTTPGWPF